MIGSRALCRFCSCVLTPVRCSIHGGSGGICSCNRWLDLLLLLLLRLLRLRWSSAQQTSESCIKVSVGSNESSRCRFSIKPHADKIGEVL